MLVAPHVLAASCSDQASYVTTRTEAGYVYSGYAGDRGTDLDCQPCTDCVYFKNCSTTLSCIYCDASSSTVCNGSQDQLGDVQTVLQKSDTAVTVRPSNYVSFIINDILKIDDRN